jgi:hypothetical protein
MVFSRFLLPRTHQILCLVPSFSLFSEHSGAPRALTRIKINPTFGFLHPRQLTVCESNSEEYVIGRRSCLIIPSVVPRFPIVIHLRI